MQTITLGGKLEHHRGHQPCPQGYRSQFKLEGAITRFNKVTKTDSTGIYVINLFVCYLFV